jgi:hypothetical protein
MSSAIYASDEESGRALKELDGIVAKKGYYTSERKKKIKRLKDLTGITEKPEQIYKLYGRIFDLYRGFRMDSSDVYARKKLKLAQNMHRQKYIYDATMNLAEVYGTEGMYREALELLDGINKKRLAKYLHPYYFHLYRTIYGLMSDYAFAREDKWKYDKITNIYRDSMLEVNRKGTYLYAMIQADGLVAEGKASEAINLLNERIGNKIDGDTLSTLAYTLAKAYKKAGDKEKEEHYLTIAAISDIKQGTKEYAALIDLSKLLYYKGDLNRSYNYLKCSIEDASFCGARLRTLEVSEIFPIVENSYRQKLAREEHRRFIIIIWLSIVSIILSVVLVFLYIQMNKLKKARKELSRLNVKLKESNLSLTEADLIKSECIKNYMGFCSLYIDKIKEYRHSLMVSVRNDGIKDLLYKLRSVSFLEDELKDFYIKFDSTFLKLFPNFTEQLNMLLTKEGHIPARSDGQLTTELRIFALIRLGITDSKEIAAFLRCSVTTVYNYRVKARNNARGDRGKLEEEIMKIGKM